MAFIQDMIPYPDNISELEVQSRLFAALINIGYDVRIEVRGYIGYSEEYLAGGHRFDLVVFRNKVAICIIEVKHSRVNWKPTYNTSQNESYRQYGLPYIGCVGIKGIANAVREVSMI